MGEIYEPQEDSFMLLEQVKKYSKGFVLDMGTGSGIQAIEAAKNSSLVIAADINDEAIEYAKKEAENTNNIKFVKTDLFSNLQNYKNSFDTIIFNPPYLPDDERAKDIALDGGKEGYELTEKFFNKVNDYLKEDGKILLVFSSLTNKEKIDGIIKKNHFRKKLIDSKKMFFEEFYVYLWKNEFIAFTYCSNCCCAESN